MSDASSPATPAALADRRERLAAVQARAAARRAAAFVRYAPQVCGLTLRPLTLDSYSRLRAFDNAFVTGARAPGLDDIFIFVWVHHPDFGQFAHAARRRVLRQVVRALEPRWPTLNALCRFFAPFPRLRWLRRFCRPTADERFVAACVEISRLVSEAIAEYPGGSSSGGPLPCAIEAHYLNTLRRELDVPFDEARHLPLKELVQHVREITHHHKGDCLALLTPEEAAIWREHLA